MNSLQQTESLLIGSPDAIEKLAGQDESLILVVSDSHGSSRMLGYILREWGARSDALVFCGDGAGDIYSLLFTASDDTLLKNLIPPVIALVQGNNDPGGYALWDGTQMKVPLNQTMTASGHTIFITHGHRFSLYESTACLVSEAQLQEAELVLYGHTHVAMAESAYGMLTLNPGSCALPRRGQPPCFMTLKLKKGSAFFDYSFYRIAGTKSAPFNPTIRGFF